MDCPATVRAVRQLTAKWPATIAKLIEDKANGSAVIQMLAHEIPGLLPVNPGGGKVARAAAVSPLIEAGNIFLLHPLYAPWVNDFIEECAAFPNGAHDDQVDAMTQALLRWHMAVQQETVWYLPDYPRGCQISPI
jgi:predicted phage terminase large subunit-like protein